MEMFPIRPHMWKLRGQLVQREVAMVQKPDPTSQEYIRKLGLPLLGDKNPPLFVRMVRKVLQRQRVRRRVNLRSGETAILAKDLQRRQSVRSLRIRSPASHYLVRLSISNPKTRILVMAYPVRGNAGAPRGACTFQIQCSTIDEAGPIFMFQAHHPAHKAPQTSRYFPFLRRFPHSHR